MKPFNLEHAKAGAPVQLEDGTEARIVATNGRNSAFPLVVLVGGKDYPRLGSEMGVISFGPVSACKKLIMAPMGYCDGFPVHVGDMLINKGSGLLRQIGPGTLDRDWSGYMWKIDRPNSLTHPQLGRIYGDPAFLEHVAVLMIHNTPEAVARSMYNWGYRDAKMDVQAIPSNADFISELAKQYERVKL